MVVRDGSRDQTIESESGIVELQTYKKMDWKELAEHPLSSLTRIFGQDYLMSNIGSRPDQETFIELDQIHNFSHLMIEYALANRIVGPLDQIESVTPNAPLPKDLVMDIQQPPGRLKKILSNLNEDQGSIDYEETTLASIVARHSSSLKPYDMLQDQLERTLKQSSPDEKAGTARQDLPPTLVEQIVANIYKARHAQGYQVEISANLDQAISRSWELVNQRIGGLLTPSEATLVQDRARYDKGLIDKYREEHVGYTEKLVNQRELRRQRNSERQEADERRKRELAQIEKTKAEQATAYENGIKLRAGLLFPDMPESDRRSALYKKSLLAAQTLVLTDFILDTDLDQGSELIAAMKRSIQPKLVDQKEEVAAAEPLEPALQLRMSKKALDKLLYGLITSRDKNSHKLLQEFSEAASLEYERIISDGHEQNDQTRKIEAVVNTNLTLDQLAGEELSKLEIEAKILLDY